MDIKHKISELLTEKLPLFGLFLVDVKISPSRIVVSIDHPQGVKLEDCVEISRFLRDSLDATDVFEKHELEVGSPGMEEPLKVLPQYTKRIGQSVSVITFDGMKRIGTLLNVDDSGLRIMPELKGKKKITSEPPQELYIPFTEIKETKVNFSFDKII
ncbi:MAG: ribosome assembly cofactor RimP [Bacteroidetes bacterium]|nr:MAG: ribosome assembly cofactor RimP [Bacteroidota bacterium]REK04817.1 MAG: ribosome assembly cofactor RimP [Bacteroidota bacterium]REK36290.1 MAG: ribosome assembly cofactor RimP [Bacteroidota bacterium]REK51046.1 MAG: ribosome assembly cofactor RimP [Bacteroidota bacterium]